MNYIEELKIDKNHLSFIINKYNIEIRELIIKDFFVGDYINLAIKNKNYVINNKIENLSILLLLNKMTAELSIEEVIELEYIIMKNAEYSFSYAQRLNKISVNKRFLIGEYVISESSEYAYRYAALLKTRWDDFENIDPIMIETAENSIIKNKKYLFLYIKELMNGKRWKKAEDYLLTSDDPSISEYIVSYADSIIIGQWPEAEHKIFTNIKSAMKYALYVIKKRLPEEIENEILNYPLSELSLNYITKIYKKRWPEYEKKLIDIKNRYDLEGDFEEQHGEDNEEGSFIESTIFTYATEVIKGPWPEAGIFY